MPNSVISSITLPSGTTYDLKDAYARERIEALSKYTEFLGVTTTALTDGSTTNPITINGESVTAKKGDIATYQSAEFIWNGTAWQEFGDLGALGDLAYVDTAEATYTPAGTVSQPTFTGSSVNLNMSISANESGNYQPAGTVSQPTFSDGAVTASGSFTPSGSVSVSTNSTTDMTATVAPAGSGEATYTPAGSVAAPTISVATAGSTTTVNSITDVGTLPSWTGTVSGETLTFAWSQGTLPTKGSDTTVKTGDASYEATAPAFTGTGVRLETGAIAVPSTYTASFTGSSGSVSVTGTATGTVSQPTFTGTKVEIAGTATAAGTVSQPTFTGTEATITVAPAT